MTEPKWWDFTASKNMGWTIDRLRPILDEVSERYVVGDEVGEGGYEHIQGRVVFKVGKELGACQNLIPGAHWSQSHVRDFNYCEKEGNFFRSWEKGLREYQCLNLRGWQADAIGLLKEPDERAVHCIYDPVGNHGKTYVAKYAQVNHIAQYVPPMTEAMDFMAFAMAKPAKAYIFDMPRAETIKQKKGMWSAIEQIKNGYLYDKRYQFRDAWIEPPQILVMANELPDFGTLSADRWHFYRIDEELDFLDEYDPRCEL